MASSRRNEIDFLRALSVLSVITFHIDKEIFPLGYLGVDLFFVISGYLITRNIIKSYQKNNFSFKQFYLKRIRRILPALLVVLLTTFILAIFILLVADAQKFSESILTTLLFISNFYFWITGGYFSSSDELKPLLHLWSLSVEEQFYLFFPLFLILVFKIFKSLKVRLLCILITIAVSYWINIIFISKGHNDPIFFLFPARVWQFGIGAFFAFLPNLKIKNIFYDSCYLTTALGLIIFNFNTTIRGLPAGTLLSLGAVMVLFKLQNEKNVFFNFFNVKVLVYIGLISYSLYLWHWPIISFLKYISIGKISLLNIVLALFLTFSLATLSWKYVEQPFIKSLPTKQVLIYIFSSYFVLTLLSLIVLTSKDFPSRYDKFSNNLAKAVGSTYHCSIFDYRKYGYSYSCIINKKTTRKPEIILFGNSHAHMYGWGLKEILIKKQRQGLSVPLNSCLPFADLNISKKCLLKAESYLNTIINDQNINTVIIGFTWYVDDLIDLDGKIIDDTNYSERIKSIDKLILKLNNKGKKVYLLGPIETPQQELASVLSRKIAFEKVENYNLSVKKEDFYSKYKVPLNYFSKKLKKNFLLPHEILCDNKKCYFADKNGSYFSDTNHLSFYGSSKMKSLFNF